MLTQIRNFLPVNLLAFKRSFPFTTSTKGVLGYKYIGCHQRVAWWLIIGGKLEIKTTKRHLSY
jgi:hypothetical protein